MQRSTYIQRFYSLLFALLLAFGPAASIWSHGARLVDGAAIACYQPTDGQPSEDGEKLPQLVQAHAFHAVITANFHVPPATMPSPAPQQEKPLAIVTQAALPICVPATLCYYCNLRHHFIAPQAP